MAIDREKFLTFDDVLLRPGYSEVLPSEVTLASLFSSRIPLNTPLVSAAMDTVTEAATAIVMAQEGGIGVIHKNISPEEQAREVKKVKRYETGRILDPVTVGPDWSLREVVQMTSRHNITGVPVVDGDRKLLGILTGRDLRFEVDFSRKVREVMTPKERLVSAHESIPLDRAQALLHKHRIEKLPTVDDEGRLSGLITVKDILRACAHPNATKDNLGRLRVAAAIGAGEKERERAQALVENHVDSLVVDTAHGHSRCVIEMVKALVKAYPEVDIVGGNVATEDGALALIRAGVHGVKVGIGPGSICTTRVVAGVGVPQLSAILSCHKACAKNNIPLISDGGTKYSGDIVKALAAGATAVMVGRLFAGTDEAPGERILYKGRSYKVYRGMGSMEAMVLGSGDRYFQGNVQDSQKLVPEGIEGQVPYKGPAENVLHQLMGGVRAAMGYTGNATIADLQANARFLRITGAGLSESHVHDVTITREEPNYRPRV